MLSVDTKELIKSIVTVINEIEKSLPVGCLWFSKFLVSFHVGKSHGESILFMNVGYYYTHIINPSLIRYTNLNKTITYRHSREIN